MRTIGLMHPTDLIPVPPDTVGTAVISSASAVVALDYPDDAHLVRFGSTAGFWLDMESTSVAIPTASSKGTTAARNEYVESGMYYQIPGDSTGLSITAATSGVVSLSYWRR
jgi:hypothetical protein